MHFYVIKILYIFYGFTAFSKKNRTKTQLFTAFSKKAVPKTLYGFFKKRCSKNSLRFFQKKM
jgi:hypothetical protein